MTDLSSILTGVLPASRGKAYGVASGIGRQILSGSVPPGTELTSRKVMAHYTVSYTTVREAFALLRECGLVHVHQGNPTRVNAHARWEILHPEVLAWAPTGGWLLRDAAECADLVEKLSQEHEGNTALRRLADRLAGR